MARLGLCAALVFPLAAHGVVLHSRQEVASQRAPEDILQMGEKMTQDVWMQTGPEALQALRQKMFKTGSFKTKVQDLCPSGGECAFAKGNQLFCKALDVAASDGKFGDLDKLETLMSATVSSSRFYGIDTATLSALIARWQSEEMWEPPRVAAASREATDAFSGLHERISSSPDFTDLITATCGGELESLRPRCKAHAMSGVFCQALGQSAAVMLGATEGSKLLGEVVLTM